MPDEALAGLSAYEGRQGKGEQRWWKGHHNGMRHVWLITLLLWLQFSCAGDTSDLRMKLDDAVQRRASITERILEWGAPSEKQSLIDGRTLYTWTIPWAWRSVDPLCTIVITASADNVVEGYEYHSC